MRLSFEPVLLELLDHETAANLISGDLFDDRDLRPQVLKDAERALARIPDNIPVSVTAGKHDQNLHPRKATWLRHLHGRGLITLLEADLESDEAHFDHLTLARNANPEEERPVGGYVDLESEDLSGPVRVFGLQYRGGYIDTALEKVGRGIQVVNEREGEPAVTILMAHFGVTEIVPDLGGNVNFATLRSVEDYVDYPALGHLHKQYETEWIFNPGSPEARDTREAQWDDQHGYYVIDFTDKDFEATHHPSKRRAFYRTKCSVDGFATFDEFENEFREHIRGERDAVDEVSAREIHTQQGNRRPPIIDLRLKGMLTFDRTALNTERLRDIAVEELDAMYVHLSNQTQTKAIQELIGDLDDEDVFTEAGTINREALEDRVFTVIAEESEYSVRASDDAKFLSEVDELVASVESIDDIAELVKQRRRDLLPAGAEIGPDDAEVASELAPSDDDDVETGDADEAGEQVSTTDPNPSSGGGDAE